MRGCLYAGLLALSSVGARAQGLSDYTRRVPVTIQNNTGAATPTPTSAEIIVPLSSATSRGDHLDLRVGYNSGGTVQEIDSKVFNTALVAPPMYTENASAGSTGYATLPAGTAVTPTNVSGDDGGATVTLPFSFPFAGGSSDKVFFSIDGYLVPGSTQPLSQYGRDGTNETKLGIFPFTSDYTVGAAGANLYFSADATRAVFRWEVAESGQPGITVKMAAILYPNGNVRFVYSPTVQPTSADVGGPGKYAEMSYGIQTGISGAGIIHYPTDNYPTSANFSNHADILYTATGSSAPDSSARVVFRLQQPIPAGGVSSGEYFVYYGNSSPAFNARRDVTKVFDHTVDFKSAANVIGQPAPDWEVAEQPDQLTFNVEEVNGVKQGVLRRGTVSHPRAIVKDGAMPKFLNVEILANMTPGGGENEMFPMVRTPQSLTNSYPDPSRAYAGGYGYVSDGFGSQQGLVSVINPAVDRGPADFAGLVPGPNLTGQPYLTLFRAEGQLLSGKRWAVGSPEPLWTKFQVDRTAFDPQHLGVSDPIYDKPGGTGIGSYSSNFIAVEYIALRELRNLGVAAQPVETLNPAGPFIQGTVQSSSAAQNPLTTATVHITGPGGYDQTFAVGPNGEYRVSLPAGAYTVVASAVNHTTTTVTGVNPTGAGQTNITLPYVGSTISGVLRDGLTNAVAANATVTITDATGLYVGSTTSNASGAYSYIAPMGGTYHVNWFSPTGVGTTVGVPREVTVPTGGAVTFNSNGQFVGNGDAEMPNSTNTYPEGWTNNEFGQAAPDAYQYVHAVGANAGLNHTPGGHWSLAVKNPNGINAWLPPPSSFFDLPVANDAFGTTVSFWVYFTKAGQEARMRLRNNLVPASINVIAGQAPPATNENTGGLDGGLVPINKWYEIRHSFPAGTVTDPVGTIEMQMYTNGSPTVDEGTIYLDDLTITRTPIATAKGRLVDADGNPVANTLVGLLTQDNNLENTIWKGSPFVTDPDGNFSIFTTAPGPIDIAAFKLPPSTDGDVPNYGFVVDPATGTLTASATPGAPQTVRLLPATNVASGATGNAVDGNNNPVNGTGGGVIAAAVDNDLNSRWASQVGDAPVTATFTFPTAQLVDQLEILWELADASDLTIEISADGVTFDPYVDEPNALGLGLASGTINYSTATEGTTDIFRFPTARTIKAVRITANAYRGTLGNVSIIELRALSLAIPPVIPPTTADVSKALRIAGGLTTATAADLTRLDVVKADGTAGKDSLITLQDAIALRKSFP
jgi:hypothetical protein